MSCPLLPLQTVHGSYVSDVIKVGIWSLLRRDGLGMVFLVRLALGLHPVVLSGITPGVLGPLSRWGWGLNWSRCSYPVALLCCFGVSVHASQWHPPPDTPPMCWVPPEDKANAICSLASCCRLVAGLPCVPLTWVLRIGYRVSCPGKYQHMAAPFLPEAQQVSSGCGLVNPAHSLTLCLVSGPTPNSQVGSFGLFLLPARSLFACYSRLGRLLCGGTLEKLRLLPEWRTLGQSVDLKPALETLP